jgi:hypothetical protein
VTAINVEVKVEAETMARTAGAVIVTGRAVIGLAPRPQMP